jgi:cytochrome c biogenesis protein CcmG/thiol:disulfide interchange protein DsbE
VRRNSLLVWGALAVVVVAAAIIAVTSGGGGSGDSSSGGSAKPTKYEQAASTQVGTALPAFAESVGDPAIGKTIPTVTGVSVFDGSPVVLQPTGKPQAIVFLAHWCPHCQAEVPRLVALAKAGKLDGIDVVAVATGTRSDLPNYPPSTWLEGVGWPYPTMADNASSTAARAYGLTGYPMFVLTDASGKVVARSEGEISDAEIIAAVKAVKAGQPVDLSSGASSSK